MHYNLFQKEKSKNKKENNLIEDKENKKEILSIDIGKYVQPKKGDNIIRINGIIKDLINYLQENNLSFIKISYSFFEKYIYFNKLVNFGNLVYIKDIIENYIEYDESFQNKVNINELIHESGIYLAKKGLLKNLNLLKFIKNDEYSYDDINGKTKYSIDILNGIDISSLENKFFKIWKNINFELVFKNDFNNFMKKISSLIKEMKDFGLLFSFYDFYQDNEYKYESISYMQKRFIEIFDTYTNEKCPNFTDDVVKLIYWSNRKKVNLKKFLNEIIQNLLDFEKVNEIYIKFIDENQDLSKDIKEIIISFLTKNNKSEPSELLYWIKNYQQLRDDIFSSIDKYIIEEEDFFNLEENERLKFFKGLVKENY